MLGVSTPALAAAVSEAGGLGALAIGSQGPGAAVEAVEAVRALTDKPFNLNLFCDPVSDPPPPDRAAMRRVGAFYKHLDAGEMPEVPDPPPPAMTEEMVETLCRLAPPVVSFHFGLPNGGIVPRLREAGCKVISTATTVAEARCLESRGVDAIIAQGWEAGGHRGSHQPCLPDEGVGTMALLPQVADAVRLPVIAAGGIGDARGIAAAFVLGAAAVQMGTAFLRCPEAGTDAPRRKLLETATDADTMPTDAVSGRVARAVRSRFAEALLPHAGKLPPFPTMYALSGPLRGKTREGEDAPVVSFHLYGQAAPLAREMPAGELLALLAEGALARIGVE